MIQTCGERLNPEETTPHSEASPRCRGLQAANTGHRWLSASKRRQRGGAVSASPLCLASRGSEEVSEHDTDLWGTAKP